MEKKAYDYVFVVLTYRSWQDLCSFFESLRACDGLYTVIVVNSFYDDESNKKIQDIAEKNNAHFIRIENKGYGYGNNRGIEYALENYEFRYLIISNPDIEVLKFDKDSLEGMEYAVVAPKIKCLNGKMQNPMFFVKSDFALKLIYSGLKNNKKNAFLTGCGINKIIRIYGIFNAKMLKRKKIKIYQAHGSFVIFSKEVLMQLKGKVYDEAIFLFAEECYLAKILEEQKIETYYVPSIEVLHKEDGSMKYRDDISEQMRKANLYVYEKYYHFIED